MLGGRVLSLFEIWQVGVCRFEIGHVRVSRLRFRQECRLSGASCLALKRIIAAIFATVVATLTSASTQRKGRWSRRLHTECGVSSAALPIFLEGASLLLANKRFIQFRINPKLSGHLSTIKGLWRLARPCQKCSKTVSY